MVKPTNQWKPGRGALGRLQPLIGAWRHAGKSKLGLTTCNRTFAPVLSGKFIELRAEWRTPGKVYQEIALFGQNRDKQLAFWSYTSDGGRSEGEISEAPEIHARSLCFEADMPAGRARMLYWPHEEEGFWFAVEARNKKGWNRFLEQHFTSTR